MLPSGLLGDLLRYKMAFLDANSQSLLSQQLVEDRLKRKDLQDLPQSRLEELLPVVGLRD